MHAPPPPPVQGLQRSAVIMGVCTVASVKPVADLVTRARPSYIITLELHLHGGAHLPALAMPASTVLVSSLSSVIGF
jgi:hypothetical protein